jgi:hypothetical protein
MKQIALAMHVYADEHQGRLPPAAIYGKDGQALLSWRVLLLPYLEQRELYAKFHLDEPWDSPHNQPLLKEMPKIYVRPMSSGAADKYGTIYQAFVGKGTVFESKEGMSLGELTNRGSMSSTMLIVDAAERVPWTKPDDLVYAEDQPLPAFGGLHRDRGFRPFSREYTPVTFQVAFTDGHVQNIPLQWGESRIRSIILYAQASQAVLP